MKRRKYVNARRSFEECRKLVLELPACSLKIILLNYLEVMWIEETKDFTPVRNELILPIKSLMRKEEEP